MPDVEDSSPSYHSLLQEYARLASRYDQRWSFYIQATIQESLNRLEGRPNDRVMDVGCGTGAFLHVLRLSYPTLELAGVDPSPAMLAIARARLGSSVDLQEGWAEGLPFPEQSFNIVISSSVFHYICEPEAALREIGRVLVPGGELLITDWCGDFLACRVCDWLLRMVNHGHFRAYRESELRRLMNTAPFMVTRSDRYKINWLWGLMTVIACRDAAGRSEG